MKPETVWREKSCIGCGACNSICLSVAIGLSASRKFVDRELCAVSGNCVEACPTASFEILGKWMSVSELLPEVEKDRPYYEETGGGVTVSGGEPLLQSEFVAEFLAACRDADLNTAVETSGEVPWENLARVLPFTSVLLYDIKHMDSEMHRRWTGAPNGRILENLRRARKEVGTPVIVRIPVIPGCNDSEENMRQTVAGVQALSPLAIHLMPYHGCCESKYEMLGTRYPLRGAPSLSQEKLETHQKIAEDAGLPCLIN